MFTKNLHRTSNKTKINQRCRIEFSILLLLIEKLCNFLFQQGQTDSEIDRHSSSRLRFFMQLASAVLKRFCLYSAKRKIILQLILLLLIPSSRHLLQHSWRHLPAPDFSRRRRLQLDHHDDARRRQLI